MTETNNTNDKPGLAPKLTLHLKRPVEQGTVRQSFSHGRTKAVVVEKVKRRIPGPGEALAAREPIALKPAAPVAAPAPAPALAFRINLPLGPDRQAKCCVVASQSSRQAVAAASRPGSSIAASVKIPLASATRRWCLITLSVGSAQTSYETSQAALVAHIANEREKPSMKNIIKSHKNH